MIVSLFQSWFKIVKLLNLKPSQIIFIMFEFQSAYSKFYQQSLVFKRVDIL